MRDIDEGVTSTADTEGDSMNEVDEPRPSGSAPEITSPEVIPPSEPRPDGVSPQPVPVKSASPEDVLEQSTSHPRHRAGKRLAIILVCFILGALITVAGVLFTSNNNVTKIIADIEQKDEKLVERTQSALGITSQLEFADAIAETDAVTAERSSLVARLEQQKSAYFQQKLDSLKDTLVAENTQLSKDQVTRLQRELKKLVQRDNVALGDVFLMGRTTSTLSWQEVFDGVDKNVVDRTALISEIKLMPTLKFQHTLESYVALLEAENDFCRTYGYYMRAAFNYRSEANYFMSRHYYSISTLDSAYAVVKKAEAECSKAGAEFSDKYAVLLKEDKSFWPNAKAVFPSRDLQKALSDFFKKVDSEIGSKGT